MTPCTELEARAPLKNTRQRYSMDFVTLIGAVVCVAFGCMVSSQARDQERLISRGETPQAQRADIIDTSPWADVLRDVVRGERVIYTQLKDPDTKAKLDHFVNALQAPLPQGASRPARLAYWINAYNALILRHVMRYPELSSVATAVPQAPRYTFFTQNIHLVAGRRRSLDEIEHHILRPHFKDPRVHAALNCASRSCPPLSATPYRAHMIDAQLNEVTRRFVNDRRRNRFDTYPPRLSKIFSWFAEDFTQDQDTKSPSSSGAHQGVTHFIRRFADAKNLQLIENLWPKQTGAIELQFDEYDWALNGPRP